MLRRCIIPALPHLSRPPLAAVAKDDEHVYSFRTSRSLRVWPSLSLSLSISLFHHFYSSFQQIQTVMDCFDDKSCIGRCRHLVCLDAATTSSASNGCPWSYSLSINTTQGKPLVKLMTCMFCQLKQMRKKTHHYWPHPPQSCIAFLLSFFLYPLLLFFVSQLPSFSVLVERFVRFFFFPWLTTSTTHQKMKYKNRDKSSVSSCVVNFVHQSTTLLCHTTRWRTRWSNFLRSLPKIIFHHHQHTSFVPTASSCCFIFIHSS